MHEHTEDAKKEEDHSRLPVRLRDSQDTVNWLPIFKVKIAIYASLFANIILCILQCMLRLSISSAIAIRRFLQCMQPYRLALFPCLLQALIQYLMLEVTSFCGGFIEKLNH